jgi:ketosteroid isomerase-like protein
MRSAIPSRRFFLLTIVLGLVALGISLPAAAEPKHVGKKDFKHEIESLEDQWRVAQLANDVATMDKLLSEDYVGISMAGQVNTKAQQLDRVRNRTLNITSMTLSDVKVKLIGKIAIVTSLAEIVGSNDGASMTGTYRYTRVYQRLPTGAWKITNFEATRVPKNRLNAKS